MTTQPPPAFGATTHVTASTDGSLLRRLAEHEAARIVAAGAGAGLFAQLLFVGQSSGINVLLWVSLALVVAVATRPRDARLDRYDAWLPVAAVAFAGLIALRDDPLLLLFNLFAGGWLTLLSVVALGGFPLTRSTAAVVSGAALAATVAASFGATLLGPGLRPIARPVLRGGPRATALARGLLIGVPLMLIFLGLFSAADGVFGAQLAALTRLDLLERDMALRLLFAAAAGWLFAGTMLAAWLRRTSDAAAMAADGTVEAVPGAGTAAGGWRLGALEALVVLVLLNAVFVLFVAVQAAYLFGGLDTLAVSGLTYADYARRGFFELIAVATLIGLVLLAFGRFVVRPDRLLKGAAILLAVLTGLVLVSATYRMGLYQGAYGWTELRFHALAAIAWLALCLVAAIVATATDRQRWLPVSVVMAALVVAVSVNVIGPQAFVVERNLERAANPSLVAPGGETGLDIYYLEGMGADAVPAMVAARDSLPTADSRRVDRILRGMASNLRADDRRAGWPSFNLARHRALEVLAAAGY